MIAVAQVPQVTVPMERAKVETCCAQEAEERGMGDARALALMPMSLEKRRMGSEWREAVFSHRSWWVSKWIWRRSR